MTPLDGKVVLVTGAGGFVGPHLARALEERGARVHGLGIERPRVDLGLASWSAADLLDSAPLHAALAAVKPDLIAHLAGQSSAARSFSDPVETYRANAIGTWNLLEAVRVIVPGARVLVVGTGEVYGPQPAGSRVREDAPLRPVNPYALSKAVADRLAAVLCERNDLDVVRTRSFAHAGPGQSPTFAIPSWAEQIVAIEAGRSEPLLRVGNLEVTRDLTDVRDVARAYVALLERGQAGAAYNVCRGEGVTLAEVVRMLVERSQVAVRVEVDPERIRPVDVPYLVGDPSLLKAETGWQAHIQLGRTLDDLLREWRGKSETARGGATPPAGAG